MGVFSQKFSKLKQGRSLQWLSSVGTVSIELELQDRTLDFTVNPEKASAISLFHDKGKQRVSLSHDMAMFINNYLGSLNLQEVASRLGVEKDKAKELLTFWENQGVIKGSGDESETFQVLEKAEKSTSKGTIPWLNVNVKLLTWPLIVFSDETSSNDIIEESREEMRIYWSYIQGMLTNLGAVNAEKIHSFLKMLVPKETPYSKSLEELKQFLEFMVEEENLIVSPDGLYKLQR